MNDDKIEVSEKRSLTARRLIYYVLGILEILLAFRLVFKLLGANPGSGLVSFIYSITNILLSPFTAIFRSAVTQGIETTAVFEPGTLIAMAVYALIAWGIVKLIAVLRGDRQGNF